MKKAAIVEAPRALRFTDSGECAAPKHKSALVNQGVEV